MSTDDPYLWLEETRGDDALRWVDEENARTLSALTGERFESLRSGIREALDSDGRVPFVSRHGDLLYNFWRDAEHPRGLWRRTTLESYAADDTSWEVLLDIDALGAAEGVPWTFAGARHLPAGGLALVHLSPDGGDASELREFDLLAGRFVPDGFTVPSAKGSASWVSRNELLVATTLVGGATESGYARTVRRWSRGTPLADAPVVFEAEADDVMVGGYHEAGVGAERDMIIRRRDFWTSTLHLLTGAGAVQVPIPEDAVAVGHGALLLLLLRSDWSTDAGMLPAGALVAAPFDDALRGAAHWQTLFEPTAARTLEDVDRTREHLLLTVLENVASSIELLTPEPDGTWSRLVVAGGDAALESIGVVATNPLGADPELSEEYWISRTGFLTPPSVSRGIAPGAPGEPLKSAPALFDTGSAVVAQHWAVSDDGTRVLYFQVGPADARDAPTLLSGYGGFEVSRTPVYTAAVGRGWLERGGTFVVAGIRGGGEFGPSWHRSALRENRHRAYEDFAAVARDLISRGVTSPERLACRGGSNGGLLVGNMLTTYPELFAAVECAVPLLDMQRYTHLHAGASWVAEYGDPEVPADWEHLRTYSPYALVRENGHYPRALFTTATSDDRVGPEQARKMAARMRGWNLPGVLFYENRQGGHGGSGDNAEAARLAALGYEFLWRAVLGEPDSAPAV